jgi:hypothetical protein
MIAIHNKTRKRKVVLSKFRGVRQIQATKAGVLFVAENTGVPNLYKSNLRLTDATAVTNSKTQIYSGALDPGTGELFVSELTAKGPKIKVGPKIQVQRPPHIPSLISTSSPAKKIQGYDKKLKMEERDYSPYSYLWPRYWIPFLSPIDGGFLFQGSTSISDPLGFHSYQLQGSYDSLTKKMGYGVSYSNRATSLGMSLSYAQSYDYYYALGLVRESNFWSAGLSSYLWSRRWSGQARWSSQSSKITRSIERQGPSLGVTFSNLSDPSRKGLFGDGTSLSIAHTQYLESEANKSFGRSSFSFYQTFSRPFPARQSLAWKLKGVLASDMHISNLFTWGETTASGNYLADIVTSGFLMRGYPSTEFLGRTLVNTNLEYQFRVADLYRGKGTLPLFFRKVDATFFVDGISVDGAYNSEKTGGYLRAGMHESFWSVGGELKLATTFAYHMPLTFIFGAYYGLNADAYGGFVPFISMAADSLF